MGGKAIAQSTEKGKTSLAAEWRVPYRGEAGSLSVVWVRGGEPGYTWSGSIRDGEKWLDSCCALQVELTVLLRACTWKARENAVSRIMPRFFAVSHWAMLLRHGNDLPPSTWRSFTLKCPKDVASSTTATLLGCIQWQESLPSPLVLASCSRSAAG